MDETAVWFDMVFPTTIDTQGMKSVALKTTGHEKSHLTVVLNTKANNNNNNNSSLVSSSKGLFAK